MLKLFRKPETETGKIVASDLHLGDYVLVRGTIKGHVRFLGKTLFKVSECSDE